MPPFQFQPNSATQTFSGLSSQYPPTTPTPQQNNNPMGQPQSFRPGESPWLRGNSQPNLSQFPGGNYGANATNIGSPGYVHPQRPDNSYGSVMDQYGGGNMFTDQQLQNNLGFTADGTPNYRPTGQPLDQMYQDNVDRVSRLNEHNATFGNLAGPLNQVMGERQAARDANSWRYNSPMAAANAIESQRRTQAFQTPAWQQLQTQNRLGNLNPQQQANMINFQSRPYGGTQGQFNQGFASNIANTSGGLGSWNYNPSQQQVNTMGQIASKKQFTNSSSPWGSAQVQTRNFGG